MKFSERWLRTLVDPPLDSAALQEALTMAGLEVEAAEPAAPAFSGVVVGRIVAVEPHPGADRLRVCTVDVGTGTALRVVCGAPNATAGMRAPCAVIGAKLPGNVVITKAVMRGVESEGMLCSAKELGIADDASGLLVLADDAPIGRNVREALSLDDTLITLKLTPNRADCLSILGIAREVAAITGASLNTPPIDTTPVTSSALRPVRVEDPAACPRFASRVIEDIDPTAPTPSWMRERLERSGIRSISAIVDITNYVMLEVGQPLHAYDDRLLSGSIVVRFAQQGEKLTLLNEQTLDLEPDLLIVADEEKTLGLAGIMGGEHSGIGDTTTTVFLEGAHWNPSVIQGKSRRLGFVSDAGYRFERGVDPAAGPIGVERATQLILEICGGRAGPLNDVVAELPDRPTVPVRAARVRRLLGIDIGDEEIAGIFARLGFGLTPTAGGWHIAPPSYRFDLAIEEDFVEEVARLHGFDRVPATPRPHVEHMLPAPESKRSALDFRERLAARGWNEVVTFSFVDSATEAMLFPNRPEAEHPIKVLTPIASHLDVMRTSLAPGLLDVLHTNLAHREDRVRIFELGRCFERGSHGERQPVRLGGLAFGEALPEQWGAGKRGVDLYDVKGDLQALLAPLELRTEAAPHPALHPGRSASITVAGESIGWLGELHPRLVRAFELPRAPVLFEIELAPVSTVPVPVAAPVSKLPRVRRDMAMVVDEKVTAQALLDALNSTRTPTMESISIFDVYRGAAIGPGKKSVAILVVMQDTERTLTDAEIDAAMAKLVGVVVDRFNGALRQ